MAKHDDDKENQSANPIMVNVTRGGIVESRHRGAIAIVDNKGNVKAAWGDIKRNIFPRSANKALQALAMVESGAIDKFGFSDAEIAFACSSHGGEDIHILAAKSMLDKLSLDADALECGIHWPFNEDSQRQLASNNKKPCQLHNNCSGKHSAMLAASLMMNIKIKGYSQQTHPLQQRILGIIEDICGIDMSNSAVGIDGCSIPTFALPLENLAYGFARFIAPDDLSDQRAKACKIITKAVFAHPEMVAGSKRYCSDMMRIMGSRVFLKTGAEGVYIAGLPEYGLGIAVKCDDGTTRGAEMMMSAALQYTGVFTEQDMEKITNFIDIPLKNHVGTIVGNICPSDSFIDSKNN